MQGFRKSALKAPGLRLVSIQNKLDLDFKLKIEIKTLIKSRASTMERLSMCRPSRDSRSSGSCGA